MYPSTLFISDSKLCKCPKPKWNINEISHNISCWVSGWRVAWFIKTYFVSISIKTSPFQTWTKWNFIKKKQKCLFCGHDKFFSVNGRSDNKEVKLLKMKLFITAENRRRIYGRDISFFGFQLWLRNSAIDRRWKASFMLIEMEKNTFILCVDADHPSSS